MKKILKIVFGSLLAVLLILLGGWLFLNYAPQKGTDKKAIDMRLEAAALYEDFAADESAGNHKYIGKILQVKGVVGEKLVDENQAPVIVLRESDAMAGVMCTLLKDQQAAFDNASVGQNITIKGKCNGMLMDVVLDEGRNY